MVHRSLSGDSSATLCPSECWLGLEYVPIKRTDLQSSTSPTQPVLCIGLGSRSAGPATYQLGAEGKPPRLPGPHFPHLQMEIITVPSMEQAQHSGPHSYHHCFQEGC